MHLGWRDRLASLFVVSGTLLYVAWLAGVGSHDGGEVRLLAALVLALGMVASASAVVPGFVELLHGSRAYLVTTSLIGLAALVAGIAAFVGPSETWLGVLVGTTVALWAISTAHHVMLAGGANRARAATG